MEFHRGATTEKTHIFPFLFSKKFERKLVSSVCEQSIKKYVMMKMTNNAIDLGNSRGRGEPTAK